MVGRIEIPLYITLYIYITYINTDPHFFPTLAAAHLLVHLWDRPDLHPDREHPERHEGELPQQQNGE